MSLFNIETIKAKTAALRGGAQTEETRLSPKNRAIIAAVNSGEWGCQDASVRALVGAIIGVEIPVKASANGKYVIGTAIVWRGETLIVTRLDGDGDARFVNDEGGNDVSGDEYICTSKADQVSIATDEQIEAFFA